MVNYNNRIIHVFPNCTWKLVEPNNWDSFLWTTHNKLITFEKQIARNKVKIFVDRLIAEGLVPKIIDFVCIMSLPSSPFNLFPLFPSFQDFLHVQFADSL